MVPSIACIPWWASVRCARANVSRETFVLDEQMFHVKHLLRTGRSLSSWRNRRKHQGKETRHMAEAQDRTLRDVAIGKTATVRRLKGGGRAQASHHGHGHHQGDERVRPQSRAVGRPDRGHSARIRGVGCARARRRASSSADVAGRKRQTTRVVALAGASLF